MIKHTVHGYPPQPSLDSIGLAHRPGEPSRPIDLVLGIPDGNGAGSGQTAVGSLPLATAETPEEFRICMINIEQKLRRVEMIRCGNRDRNRETAPGAIVPR